MTSQLTVIGGFLSGTVPGLVVKVTIILALASSTVILLHRSSAAARHFVWSLAFAACFALVLLTPAAPEIVLRLPVIQRAANHEIAGPVTTFAHAPSAEADGKAGLDSETRRFLRDASTPGAFARLTGWIELRLAGLLAGVWVLGGLGILMRCALGHVRLSHIIAGSRALSASGWSVLLRELSSETGLQRPIRLVSSDAIAIPITTGFLRPVVLLPADADSWIDERRRIVLLHELAHVARLDYLAQLIATVACAIFWFHPGFWFARAQLRTEGEHAADDRVLGLGMQGVRYATHLLEIARNGQVSRLAPAIAVGMARSTYLEGRVRAMLDSTRSRASVSRRLQLALGVAALFAIIPLAGFRAQLVAAPHRSTATLHTPNAAALSPLTADFAAAAHRRPSPQTPKTEQPEVRTTIRESDSTFEKTIDAAPGEEISLDLRTGGAVVIHAWDEPRVRLQARLGGADWRETRVTLERSEGGIRLRSELDSDGRSSETSHEFELWVPHRFNVHITSAGGGITIDGLEGRFEGHTGGGPITIDGASGSAELSTGGGDVRVTHSNLNGSLRTGGGVVSLSDVHGDIRAFGNGSESRSGVDVGERRGVVSENRSGVEVGESHGVVSETRSGEEAGERHGTVSVEGGSGTERTNVSRSGVIETRGYGLSTGRSEARTVISERGVTTTDSEPGGAGEIVITKAGGSIRLEHVPRGGTLRTGGGDITVGESSGNLSVRTGGGDIELSHVAGDAAAVTGAGAVSITVVDGEGSEHSVNVQSGSGRVVIELPANLDARFELETAYTENFGRRTKIESDWDLNQESTDSWDASQGTPRKFVRAFGTVGEGHGLIKVRTVNGDVVIKRVER